MIHIPVNSRSFLLATNAVKKKREETRRGKKRKKAQNYPTHVYKLFLKHFPFHRLNNLSLLFHPVTFFFFAYQAPNSRHSLNDVLLSSIRSLIIFPSHMSHSSWLLPLTSRRMGSRA